MSGPRADVPSIAAVLALARRVFPSGSAPAVERMPDGVSTFVYRVDRGRETFYLRLLPEVGDTFAPEVRAHAILRARGVRVPEVVYYEPLDAATGLSAMVTTAIPGEPVARRGLTAETAAVIAAAGRDLAIINSVPVAGFGWVDRDPAHVVALAADLPTNRAFLTGHLEGDLTLLAGQLLGSDESGAIRAIVAARDPWLDAPHGLLAHGDLDVTHIYVHEGRYAGIIDFGELRGADRWYDLGHFAMREGERLPVPALPWLLAGYASVAPLPDDALARIGFASLLIAIRALARSVARCGPAGHDASALRTARREVAALLRRTSP